MVVKKEKINSAKLAGYSELIERYAIHSIPNWHSSRVSANGSSSINLNDEIVYETFPSKYWPGNSLGDHLEFALKYDGTNLVLLALLFQAMPANELVEHIRSKPIGKYVRRLWFLYEFLTGNQLPLEDLKSGNYVHVLEPDKYYTVNPGTRIRRQRVIDNLLGTQDFCPIVRRTKTLKEFEQQDFHANCQSIVSSYTPEFLNRAIHYLYTKETRSSFAIEHVNPSSDLTRQFVALLQLAKNKDFCNKNQLVLLQNTIVDPRFKNTDYRKLQNYVGETLTYQNELIHYICPSPSSVPQLMQGLIESHKRMSVGEVSPVVHGAAVSYGFVFLHPFDDGNGRIHRFLIHNILAQRGFTPKEVTLPVSAVMLQNLANYNTSLEAFSRQLNPLVNYSLDTNGIMTVHNDTMVWYQYLDLTTQTECLFRFIKQAIKTELKDELDFLTRYDTARIAIREIVDMPDRLIDLMIRFCIQNNGRLSKAKRKSHFRLLTDEEVSSMEKAINSAYENLSGSSPVQQAKSVL